MYEPSILVVAVYSSSNNMVCHIRIIYTIGRMLIKKWDRLVKDLEEPREEKEIKKVEENDNE